MPGMGRSLQTGNSLVVSQFHSALLHQLLIVLLVVVVSAVAFNVIRTVQYRRLKADGLSAFPTAGPPCPSHWPGGCSATASGACGSSTACCRFRRPCRSVCRPG